MDSVIFEHAPGPILILDEELRLVEVNPYAKKMFGLPEERFRRMELSAINGFPDQWGRMIRENGENHKDASWGEVPFRKEDGNTIWFSVQKNTVRIGGQLLMILYFQDISRQKQAEQTIQNNKAQLETANRIARLGYWEYDYANNLLRVTDPFFAIFKTSVEEIGTYEISLEKFSAFFLPAQEMGMIGREITLGQESPVSEYHRYLEYQAKYFDGSPAWMGVHFLLLKDEKGNSMKTIGITQDITERKLVENELTKYRDHLEQLVQQRTEQLEEINKDLEAFAYSVSHDLRAPIRHINGFTSFLMKKIQPKTASVEKYLELIKAASQRMGNMIDALLHFSRLGRQDLVRLEVDLNDLVREVIRSFSPDTKHRQVEWKVGRLPTVFGDQSLLKIVFENLISNALKYTGHKEKAIIEIDTDPKNSDRSIYIKDNGIGFDMNYIDKLFGVFQRLHHEENFEGIGIGLANVQQILKKHDWSIHAEGDVDQGATFYIRLKKE